MKPLFFRSVAFVLGLAGLSATALRADAVPEAEIVISTGLLTGLHDEEDEQWMTSVEYRFSEWRRGLRPWIGLAQAENHTAFASVGLVYAYEIKNRVRLIAGLAPTFYERGNGRILGSKLECYSFGEIGYVFKNDHVLGLRFGHLSNGGLGNINPGVETLLVMYSLPLRAKK